MKHFNLLSIHFPNAFDVQGVKRVFPFLSAPLLNCSIMSTMSSGVFSMGSGSPLHVQTRCMPASRPRNYVQMENSFPLFSFGCEGSSAGQFSRPWGE